MWNPFEKADDGEDATRELPFEIDAERVPLHSSNEALSELERSVLRALEDVIDPELGLNIVDLGLVYAIDREGETLRIAVTATTPACPMADAIRRDVERCATEGSPDLLEIEVYEVWEPKWSPEFMSDEAREQLGGSGAGTSSGGLW